MPCLHLSKSRQLLHVVGVKVDVWVVAEDVLTTGSVLVAPPHRDESNVLSVLQHAVDDGDHSLFLLETHTGQFFTHNHANVVVDLRNEQDGQQGSVAFLHRNSSGKSHMFIEEILHFQIGGLTRMIFQFDDLGDDFQALFTFDNVTDSQSR